MGLLYSDFQRGQQQADMSTKINVFYILWTLLIPSSVLLAQGDFSAQLLRGSMQAYSTNPAMFPEGRFQLSLPGLYGAIQVDNLTYNELFRKDAQGRSVLDIDAAIAGLETSNVIGSQVDIETLQVATKLGSLVLGAGHRVVNHIYLDYPRTLPQLIWQGNAQFIGETIDFAPDLDIFSYHEFSLSAGMEIARGLSVGGRVKRLMGLGSIEASRGTLGLTTDEEAYALTVDADYQINSTGNFTFNSILEGVDIELSNFGTDRLQTDNTGWAFDVGASLVKERWQLHLSGVNLGASIQWKDNPVNYSLKGIYAYDGLDVAQAILDDSASFAGIADSLESLYKPTRTQQSYETSLPTRYYLSGSYNISEKWGIGAILIGEQYRGTLAPAAAMTINYQPGRFARFGGLLGWRNGRFDQLGVNTTLSLGPVWLLLATDNILTAVKIKDSERANFRVGLNLVFGRRE